MGFLQYNGGMRLDQHWIFLSPHLDDAVFSCGGLLFELAQRGAKVDVWTIFAGDPPPGPLTPFAESLHARWGTGAGSAPARRREDESACARLGAGARHFDYPDCIYRLNPDGTPVIDGEDDLFQAAYGGESELERELTAVFGGALPADVCLAAAFGIGRHVDHQLLVRAVRNLPYEVWFYPDYPYAAGDSTEKQAWEMAPGRSLLAPVGAHGLAAWQAAVEAYRSQISTFWDGPEQMRARIRAYWRSGGGGLLRT